MTDFPDFQAAMSSEVKEDDLHGAVEVLKSSHRELRRLAGSKDPELSWKQDFSLNEKGKMASEERTGTVAAV